MCLFVSANLAEILSYNWEYRKVAWPDTETVAAEWHCSDSCGLLGSQWSSRWSSVAGFDIRALPSTSSSCQARRMVPNLHLAPMDLTWNILRSVPLKVLSPNSNNLYYYLLCKVCKTISLHPIAFTSYQSFGLCVDTPCEMKRWQAALVSGHGRLLSWGGTSY